MEDEVEYAKRRSKRNRKRCVIGLSILLVLLLIIAIIVVVVVVVVPLFRDQTENGEFRLPTSISPDQYALELQPYLTPGNFTFDGSINITITCHSSTDNITLHSSNLTIHEATVKVLTEGSNPGVKKIELVPKYELLILHLKNELKAGKMYQIYIVFSGTLGTSKGFYWRSYIQGNSEKYIAATKFKPTYARRAFPCFDEPAYKSTFAVTIVRQDDYETLFSGGSKKTKEREDGWYADIYSPSVKMSTYLVAFFIGGYTTTRVSKLNVSVMAKPQIIQEAEYALGAAQNASEFYSSQLNIPLRMPKLDLVAIPNESKGEKKTLQKFNTMEQESTSWGLSMMDESSMLINPRGEEAWHMQDVAKNVAHQVAHQLFGVLVTPKWWNDMWLTESIATYLALLAADNKINTKWETLEDLKRSSDYVEFDCSELSQPLSIAVDGPSDISKIFNDALYKKGARLINMVHSLLQDKRFWQGLSTFLRNTFNVAESDDLWRQLTETQKDDSDRIDFEEVMKSWVHNRGHPIVTFKRNYHRRSGLLSQTSCLNESTLWNIPIEYVHEKNFRNKPALIWFNSTEQSLYSMPDKNDWVLLNGRLNGYFHVNYDYENWKMLAQQLKIDHRIFSPSTRYQLLYDALLLSRMNITSYDVLFELLLYMKFERNLGVKEFLAEVKLSEIWKMLRMSKVESKWKDYVLRVIGDTYRELFENDLEREELGLLPKIYLKREVAICSCYYHKESCVKNATLKSNEWLSNKEPFKNVTTLDHYLIRPYLCTAAHEENAIADKIYDCLKNKDTAYDYLKNKTEEKDMIYALGCNTDTHRSSVYIDHFINEAGDPEMIIESMLNSNDSALLLFDYLKTNIIKLKNKKHRLELLVKRLSEAVANPMELDKMSEIFENFIEEMKKEDNKKETQRITKMIDSYVEKAEKRLELVKYQLPSMIQWIKNYKINSG